MTTVEALEAQLKDQKAAAELGRMARQLADNRLFKKVILENFMVSECARYAQISADPCLKEAERADALALAQSAGHLKRYLSVVVQMGFRAEHEILSIENALEEVRQEENLGEDDEVQAA